MNQKIFIILIIGLNLLLLAGCSHKVVFHDFNRINIENCQNMFAFENFGVNNLVFYCSKSLQLNDNFRDFYLVYHNKTYGKEDDGVGIPIFLKNNHIVYYVKKGLKKMLVYNNQTYNLDSKINQNLFLITKENDLVYSTFKHISSSRLDYSDLIEIELFKNRKVIFKTKMRSKYFNDNFATAEVNGKLYILLPNSSKIFYYNVIGIDSKEKFSFYAPNLESINSGGLKYLIMHNFTIPVVHNLKNLFSLDVKDNFVYVQLVNGEKFELVILNSKNKVVLKKEIPDDILSSFYYYNNKLYEWKFLRINESSGNVKLVVDGKEMRDKFDDIRDFGVYNNRLVLGVLINDTYYLLSPKVK